MRATALGLFFFAACACYGQNAYLKWHFGFRCALDFSASPPVVLTVSAIHANEGCAAVSDSAGNLLFYTSGDTIFNATHVVMANGTGIAGSKGSTQSSLIIRRPSSSSLYYLFTTDMLGGPAGLCYSIVDMSLAAGMGSVTIKNAMLAASTTEKLCAVRHANGIDTWIVSHDFNTADFRANLLTASGVNTIAILSTVGSIHGPGGHSATGCMKASVRGAKLGLAVDNLPPTVELFDFNPSTGVVSNPLVLGSISSIYGCEFSPDGSKFYGSALNTLYQWDLCAGSNSAIVASQYSMSATPYQLQLANDGKIYVATNTASLGVINSPDLPGALCNYNNASQPVSGVSTYGLPNVPASEFRPLYSPIVATKDALSCGRVSFSGPCISPGTYTGVAWDFGHPSSGASNTAAISSPTHTFAAPGTYTVRLVMNTSSTSETAYTVLSFTVPSFTVSATDTICSGQTATLTATGATGYTWSSGSHSSSITVTPGATSVYTVSAGAPCALTKTITVVVKPCETGLVLPDRVPVKIHFDNACLRITSPEHGIIAVRDVSGRHLGSFAFDAGASVLSLEGFPDGLLLCEWSIPSARGIVKIVKQP